MPNFYRSPIRKKFLKQQMSTFHDNQHLMATLAGGVFGLGIFLFWKYSNRLSTVVLLLLSIGTGMSLACMLSLSMRTRCKDQ